MGRLPDNHSENSTYSENGRDDGQTMFKPHLSCCALHRILYPCTESQIAAKEIYRDGVRSSRGHFVKAMGLRWISLIQLTEIPRARRAWALPFLTVWALSTHCHVMQGRWHKTRTNWARQMLCSLRRWMPDRELGEAKPRLGCTASAGGLPTPLPSSHRHHT